MQPYPSIPKALLEPHTVTTEDFRDFPPKPHHYTDEKNAAKSRWVAFLKG